MKAAQHVEQTCQAQKAYRPGEAALDDPALGSRTKPFFASGSLTTRSSMPCTAASCRQTGSPVSDTYLGAGRARLDARRFGNQSARSTLGLAAAFKTLEVALVGGRQLSWPTGQGNCRQPHSWRWTLPATTRRHWPTRSKRMACRRPGQPAPCTQLRQIDGDWPRPPRSMHACLPVWQRLLAPQQSISVLTGRRWWRDARTYSVSCGPWPMSSSSGLLPSPYAGASC